ncbi:hypothetical protein IscW_ISCW017279 [Ixodes scapularis]|uniref:Uncharacterized protein n=1 Tax=Ixodes scapularis TaxID=6945 RepID=B7PAV6_IXOSC|nr:hypothetical protein IscW_ISCW017279 [Ixodes scapularis]|eukprot:XP_002407305.1 hypothetical protein IscW_ISCW017279 [Ixodes scapularis]
MCSRLRNPGCWRPPWLRSSRPRRHCPPMTTRRCNRNPRSSRHRRRMGVAPTGPSRQPASLPSTRSLTKTPHARIQMLRRKASPTTTTSEMHPPTPGGAAGGSSSSVR